MDMKVLDARANTGTGKRGLHILDLVTDTMPLPFMEKDKRRSRADALAMVQPSDEYLPCLLIDGNSLPLATFRLFLAQKTGGKINVLPFKRQKLTLTATCIKRKLNKVRKHCRANLSR